MNHKLKLTTDEIKAALEAIGQMTSRNGYSFGSWQVQTSGTRQEWQSLLNVELELGKALL
jgi:hypothetical protein